jgi:uncharacterized protein (DUF362 family)/Pyruvate/2-oxoacid:ferredoxin oxidoreductase delta subunit
MNEKILLKPNVLAGAKPEDQVTTHPSVLNGTIRYLQENGIAMLYGDSPGFEKPGPALTKAGLTQIANRYAVALGDFEKGKIIDFPQGHFCKKFTIANACFEADGIISLPKMKTHGLTRITGAVKNQFGCVAGLNKAGFHLKIPNARNFSKMLVDLNLYLKPRLYIMDGITAMEGNGPRGGDPVQMNCLIISTDPIAVDSTFCAMIDLNPKFIVTNVSGHAAKLGTYLCEEIEYVGDPLESFINKKFNIVRKPVENNIVASFVPRPIKNLIVSRPEIDRDKCIKCGICVNACPVEGKALNFKNNNKKYKPVYNYTKCIRCYCCQEVCPEKAISVTRPWLGRLVTGK